MLIISITLSLITIFIAVYICTLFHLLFQCLHLFTVYNIFLSELELCYKQKVQLDE